MHYRCNQNNPSVRGIAINDAIVINNYFSVGKMWKFGDVPPGFWIVPQAFDRLIKRFYLMPGILARISRDVVLNILQVSNGDIAPY
jgi:hypothetical protein